MCSETLSRRPTAPALAYIYDKSEFDAESRVVLSLDDDTSEHAFECMDLNELSRTSETQSRQPMAPALDHDRSDFDAELRAILSLDDDTSEQALEYMDLNGLSRTSQTRSYDPMASGEDAGSPKTNEAKKNNVKCTAKLLWRNITVDLANFRGLNRRISLQYMDALTSLVRNVQGYSSLSRCGSTSMSWNRSRAYLKTRICACNGLKNPILLAFVSSPDQSTVQHY